MCIECTSVSPPARVKYLGESWLFHVRWGCSTCSKFIMNRNDLWKIMAEIVLPLPENRASSHSIWVLDPKTHTHTHSECCGKVIVFPMMFFAPRQDHQCQSVEPRTGRGARKRGSATCDVPFMARLSQGSPSAGRSWAWRFGVLDGTLAAATRAPEMPTMTCRTLGMARHSSRWVTTLEPFRGIEPWVILDSIFDGIYSSCQLTWDSLWCSL